MSYKKSIGSIVSTSLLLVSVIIVIVGYQTWYSTYSTGLFTTVETNDNSKNIFRIEKLIGNQLFILSDINSNVTIVKVFDKNKNLLCEYNDGYSNSDLVLDMRFEEKNSTHFFDSTEFNNHGIVEGFNSVSTHPGIVSRSGRFLGNNSAVTINNLSNLNFPQDKGTINFFIKTSCSEQNFSNGVVFDRFDSSENQIFARCINSSFNFQIQAQNRSSYTGGTSADNLTNNLWNMITFMYDNVDSETVTTYFNLSVVDNDTQSIPTWTPANQQVQFGSLLNRAFVGLIDEVKIFNRTLNPLELQNLYYFNKVDLSFTQGANTINLPKCEIVSGNEYEIVVFTDKSRSIKKLISE